MNKEHKNVKDLYLEVGIKTLHTGHKPKSQQKHGQTNLRLSFGTTLILPSRKKRSRFWVRPPSRVGRQRYFTCLVWLIRLFAVRKFSKIKLDLSLFCSVTMTFCVEMINMPNQKFRERIAYIIHKKKRSGVHTVHKFLFSGNKISPLQSHFQTS